ncbi:hypothetical protein [Atlantibacter hermannii]|uniref:hypothetical protein n=1 Tax=Atlantibacter hermannii TaxID=565 RepID=UPI0028A6EDD2|nr:hypothetical protein [Atlantibacter hermannii]
MSNGNKKTYIRIKFTPHLDRSNDEPLIFNALCQLKFSGKLFQHYYFPAWQLNVNNKLNVPVILYVFNHGAIALSCHDTGTLIPIQYNSITLGLSVDELTKKFAFSPLKKNIQDLFRTTDKRCLPAI